MNEQAPRQEEPNDDTIPRLIDSVPGPIPVVPEQPKSRMQEFGGYTNIRTYAPGTRYEPGMPLPLDVDTNPRPGDPQVPKLRP